MYRAHSTAVPVSNPKEIVLYVAFIAVPAENLVGIFGWALTICLLFSSTQRRMEQYQPPKPKPLDTRL